MSPKYSSLAFDEALKEFDSHFFDAGSEPNLKVIVNANYTKTPSLAASIQDAIQIRGSITVSF